MQRKSAQEVAEAIQTGINRCRGVEFPLAKMVGFLDELRSQGWSNDDVRIVERTIRHVIAALVGDDGIME